MSDDERKGMKARLKIYFDEVRRSARERMLEFAELEEERRARGSRPALPPLEILDFPDLLGRAWGWDSLMPCSVPSNYWPLYKKYLHEYYIHNSPKANATIDDDLNVNGDDGSGLEALAESCITMEHELDSMMKRRPKLFSTDDMIILSNKIITRRAREMSNMKCCEFPAAAVALKCITKEADLMCQLLMCGCTTSALIFCGRIRQHALSFMTYKGPQNVAAAATMMAVTKEATLICELLRNELADKQASDISWSNTIREGALRAMLKIFDECSAEESTLDSIAEILVFDESGDKNCTKNEVVQNDNLQRKDKSRDQGGISTRRQRNETDEAPDTCSCSKEVGKVFSAIQQVKQAHDQLENKILSRHEHIEKSILASRQTLQGSTRSMLNHLEERTLLKQQMQQKEILQNQRNLEDSTRLMLNQLEETMLLKEQGHHTAVLQLGDLTILRMKQLEEKMLSIQKSLHTTIQQKHNQLLEADELKNSQLNKKLDKILKLLPE